MKTVQVLAADGDRFDDENKRNLRGLKWDYYSRTANPT